ECPKRPLTNGLPTRYRPPARPRRLARGPDLVRGPGVGRPEGVSTRRGQPPASPVDDRRLAVHSADIRPGRGLAAPWLSVHPASRAVCPRSTCREDSLTLSHGLVASALAGASTWPRTPPSTTRARACCSGAISMPSTGSLSRGRCARELVPRPMALTTSMLPPCSSTIERAIARPSPLPDARASPTLVPR